MHLSCRKFHATSRGKYCDLAEWRRSGKNYLVRRKIDEQREVRHLRRRTSRKSLSRVSQAEQSRVLLAEDDDAGHNRNKRTRLPERVSLTLPNARRLAYSWPTTRAWCARNASKAADEEGVPRENPPLSTLFRRLEGAKSLPRGQHWGPPSLSCCRYADSGKSMPPMPQLCHWGQWCCRRKRSLEVVTSPHDWEFSVVKKALGDWDSSRRASPSCHVWILRVFVLLESTFFVKRAFLFFSFRFSMGGLTESWVRIF